MIRFVYLLAQEGEAAEAAEAPGLHFTWLLLAVLLAIGAVVMFARGGRAMRMMAAIVLLFGVIALVLAVPAWTETVLKAGETVLKKVGTPIAEGMRSLLTLGFRHPFPFPIGWGILLGGIGLILALPRTTRTRQRVGTVISLVGLFAALAGFDPLGGFTPQVVFWFLAVLTLGAAAAAIAMRSPVYTAIWFAVSLLGTAGLFLYQGSAFLGVATIVVYAGAIVVVFLFVLMLAQPEGHAMYDRISWGPLPKPVTVLAGAWLLATLSFLFLEGGEDPLRLPPPAQATVSAAPPLADAGGMPDERAALQGELQHPEHMAHLGGELFGRHLISVELAGTLLLIALVGATSIVIQGKRDPRTAAP